MLGTELEYSSIQIFGTINYRDKKKVCLTDLEVVQGAHTFLVG